MSEQVMSAEQQEYVASLKGNLVLDAVGFVSELRKVVGSVNVLVSMLELSQKQWERFTNVDTGDHLIKGVGVSTVKSDATFTYISYMIKQYMVVKGVTATTWTKNTIASENFTNKSISSLIAAHTFNDHTELFKIVATRLMGFDDDVVDMAIATAPLKKAEKLVEYLGSKFSLGETKEEINSRYALEVGVFQSMFENNGFTANYFAWLLQKINIHYTNTSFDDFNLSRDPMEFIIQK